MSSTFIIVQLHTEVDLCSCVDLSQGVSSEAFESLVQGYDEAVEGVIGVVSAEVLVRWVF
jgi:hypothetical protein